MDYTMDDLTKEQKYLLISMYQEIVSQREKSNNINANYFADSSEVKKMFLPNASIDQVSDICWRLKAKDYLNCSPGDNLANDIVLTEKTIICMENRFRNNLKSIIEFLISIKP